MCDLETLVVYYNGLIFVFYEEREKKSKNFLEIQGRSGKEGSGESRQWKLSIPTLLSLTCTQVLWFYEHESQYRVYLFSVLFFFNFFCFLLMVNRELNKELM